MVFPLDGVVLRAGVRVPVPGVTVRVEPAGPEAITDRAGRFRVLLAPGRHRLQIDEAGFAPLTATVEVRGPTETTLRLVPTDDETDLRVVGHRAQPGARVNRGLLTRVPGTMGDPLRVVQTLPGVGAMQSLLPYPVVRGGQPGDTAYLVDNTELPLLYHAGALTSVIHPRLLDSVALHPGLAPITNARYVGGAVVATTSVPDSDVWRADVDLDLLQAGAFVSVPLFDGDTRLTLAGRYSYTSWILGVFAPELSLDFADYTVRLDQRLGPARLRLSALGVVDHFTDAAEPDPDLADRDTRFHRGQFRLDLPLPDQQVAVGIDLGLDALRMPGEATQPAHLEERLVRGFVHYSADLHPRLTLRTGVDARQRRPEPSAALRQASFAWRPYIAQGDPRHSLALWLELAWQLGALTLTPAVRLDHESGGNTATGVAPRLTASLPAGPARITAQVGQTHAPHRFFVPVPGLGDLELPVDLQRAWQASLTFARPISAGLRVELTGWRTWIGNAHHVAFTGGGLLDDLSPDPVEAVDHSRVVAREARAMGLEALLRWHWAHLEGWLAATLQRAERRLPERSAVDTAGLWQRAELDQRVLLNAVASWRFAPTWRLGGRLRFNTGRAVRVDEAGVPGRRRDASRLVELPAYWQLDLRLDTRWRFTDWVLGGYLEVQNATWQAETIAPDRTRAPFVLPTLGLHGAF